VFFAAKDRNQKMHYATLASDGGWPARLDCVDQPVIYFTFTQVSITMQT